MNHWSGWVFVLAGVAMTGVACGDDDDDMSGSSGSGGSAAGTSGASAGVGGEAIGGKAGNGNAGSATAGSESQGGTDLGQAGLSGAAGAAGQGSGGVAGAPPTQGGEAGMGAAPTDGGAAGAAGNSSDGARVVCPAVGTPFVLSANDQHTPEEEALAAAFECPLDDVSLRSFSVTRFTLASEQTIVWWSPHSLDPVYDGYRLEDDCAADGFVHAPTSHQVPSNYYVQYPSMVAEVLPAGTYTRIACQANMSTLTEAVAPAPTNTSCNTAKPLPSASSVDDQPPPGALTETRILEPARYYSFTVAAGGSVTASIYFSTAQTNAGVTSTLTGTSNGYSSDTGESRPVLEPRFPLEFQGVPPGDYCLEVQMSKGAQYQIWKTLF